MALHSIRIAEVGVRFPAARPTETGCVKIPLSGTANFSKIYYTIFMRLLRFFDKLEDLIREALSRVPIFYALVGGVGVVLFWRGVWHTADMFPFFDGPVSIIVGTLMLLSTGLLVSVFIGDQIIISGLRHEKKLTEKTELEVEAEESVLAKVHKELHLISERLARLEAKSKGK